MALTKESYVLNVEGKEITITNPDKLLWPEAGITKQLYLSYMIKAAPFMLPHVKDRLLTVIRYPHGIHGKHFYQKNVPDYAPDWVKTKVWNETHYILPNDLPTLLWLANQAALEWHVSFHKAYDETPTELVFDLDPSTPSFDAVIEAALQLKEVLDEMGLPSRVKTSGATGLQVYVPIRPVYTFEQTRQVSRFVAEYLTQKFPRTLTIERLVKQRGTKLYIDFLQHWRGKTLPAPYSPRATLSATVSTPLEWEEVPRIHPSQFTIHNVLERLSRKGDLFLPLVDPVRRYSLDPILSFLETRSR